MYVRVYIYIYYTRTYTHALWQKIQAHSTSRPASFSSRAAALHSAQRISATSLPLRRNLKHQRVRIGGRLMSEDWGHITHFMAIYGNSSKENMENSRINLELIWIHQRQSCIASFGLPLATLLTPLRCTARFPALQSLVDTLS